MAPAPGSDLQGGPRAYLESLEPWPEGSKVPKYGEYMAAVSGIVIMVWGVCSTFGSKYGLMGTWTLRAGLKIAQSVGTIYTIHFGPQSIGFVDIPGARREGAGGCCWLSCGDLVLD